MEDEVSVEQQILFASFIVFVLNLIVFILVVVAFALKVIGG